MSDQGPPPTDANPLQAYFDWQVTTLMLAHDLHDPVPEGDEEAAIARRQQMEREVSALTLAIVPDQYKQDETLDWPPELMREITKLTIRRAAQIVNQGLSG